MKAVVGVRVQLRIYDVKSRQTFVVLRLDDFDRLGDLSWSPDGKYLAFAQGDGRSAPRSLWVVAINGTARQRLEDGFLPAWSPDGKHLLYAQPGGARLLEWYTLDVQAQGT